MRPLLYCYLFILIRVLPVVLRAQNLFQTLDSTVQPTFDLVIDGLKALVFDPQGLGIGVIAAARGRRAGFCRLFQPRQRGFDPLEGSVDPRRFTDDCHAYPHPLQILRFAQWQKQDAE